MKPEEQWTPVDYWSDLSKGNLEPETYIRVGNELATYAACLETTNADLLAALNSVNMILAVWLRDPAKLPNTLKASIQAVTEQAIRQSKEQSQ